MRKSTLIVGVLGGLIMFFQNCAPPMKAAQDEIAGRTPDAAADESNYRKLSADSFDTLAIIDNEKNIEIDLASGRADAFVGSSKAASYCFKAGDLDKARGILDKAEVCEPIQAYMKSEGTMCTMIYGYAYAALGKGSSRLSLGEKFNGCHIPTDLCGDAAAELRAEVARLKSLLPSRSCN